MTLHDYWLMCHRGQLLDDRYRVCKGPEPAGCANCLGPAAGIGAAGFAGAGMMRAFAGRLPPMIAQRMISRVRGVSGRFSSDRRVSSEARRRLEHMREVCTGVTHFFAPADHIRRRFIERDGTDRGHDAAVMGVVTVGVNGHDGPLRLGARTCASVQRPQRE